MRYECAMCDACKIQLAGHGLAHLYIYSSMHPILLCVACLMLDQGAATMAVVAFANDRTCCMLVRASAATGRCGYEALAEWAGGKRARVSLRHAQAVPTQQCTLITLCFYLKCLMKGLQSQAQEALPQHHFQHSTFTLGGAHPHTALHPARAHIHARSFLMCSHLCNPRC